MHGPRATNLTLNYNMTPPAHFEHMHKHIRCVKSVKRSLECDRREKANSAITNQEFQFPQLKEMRRRALDAIHVLFLHKNLSIVVKPLRMDSGLALPGIQVANLDS